MSGHPTEQAPLLGYAPLPSRISGLRQGTWITLLVLGIITAAGGLCFGGTFAIFAMSMARMAASSGGAMRVPPAGTFWVVAAVTAGLPLLFGITEILCSLWIRRLSQTASIVALTAIGLQFLALGTMLVLAGVRMASMGARRGPDIASVIMALSFYGLIEVVLGIMGILLIKVLRERRVGVLV